MQGCASSLVLRDPPLASDTTGAEPWTSCLGRIDRRRVVCGTTPAQRGGPAATPEKSLLGAQCNTHSARPVDREHVLAASTVSGDRRIQTWATSSALQLQAALVDAATACPPQTAGKPPRQCWSSCV